MLLHHKGFIRLVGLYLYLNLHVVFRNSKSISRYSWQTLKEMNFNQKPVNLIRSLYEGQQSAVRLECGTSEWFPVTKGVRQGCILSPHLFSLYTEGIMREVSLDHRKDYYEEPSIQGVHLKDLRYADDTALLSTTPTGLEKLIKSVKEHSDEKRLLLNIKKTKIMDIDKCKKEARIAIDGEEIERVSNFEYLGLKRMERVPLRLEEG